MCLVEYLLARIYIMNLHSVIGTVDICRSLPVVYIGKLFHLHCKSDLKVTFVSETARNLYVNSFSRFCYLTQYRCQTRAMKKIKNFQITFANLLKWCLF